MKGFSVLLNYGLQLPRCSVAVVALPYSAANLFFPCHIKETLTQIPPKAKLIRHGIGEETKCTKGCFTF